MRAAMYFVANPVRFVVDRSPAPSSRSYDGAVMDLVFGPRPSAGAKRRGSCR